MLEGSHQSKTPATGDPGIQRHPESILSYVTQNALNSVNDPSITRGALSTICEEPVCLFIRFNFPVFRTYPCFIVIYDRNGSL